MAATSLSHRFQLSFWDAMIVRNAAELHCGVLWSEDLTDGHLIEVFVCGIRSDDHDRMLYGGMISYQAARSG